MSYDTGNSIQILRRTPGLLRDLLVGLPPEMVHANEGEGTWSPFDIVGHLIHGEKTDWIPRAEVVLGPSPDKRWEPFDRDAMKEISRGKTLQGLLAEFAGLRRENIAKLEAFALDETKLDRKGVHPEFGEVTLRQHLATWVAHDLSHLSQVVRVLAKQYRGDVGPWVKYLSILK
jgi:hypothetical protein